MSLIPWSRKTDTANRLAGISNLNEIVTNVLRRIPTLAASSVNGDWTPAIDVTDDEGSITITAEIPGVMPDDLKIDVNGNRVTLRGEKKASRSNGEAWWQRESTHGSFVRQISLPNDVDADQSRAKLEHGILTLSLPIVPTSKTRAVTLS